MSVEEMQRLVDTAHLVASLAHEDQHDPDGSHHIDHVTAVAAAVLGDPEAQVVAWLHDVVEDTWLDADILALCFPEVTVGAVRLITRDRGVEYDEYVEEIATADGPEGVLARKVKLADAGHNLNRSKGERARKYARVVQRIRAAMRERGEL